MLGSLRVVWVTALLVLVPIGCRTPQGPPKQVVEEIAGTLFERAARGERVPVNIPFTGEGQATPKLLKNEVSVLTPAFVDGAEVYQYDVRLSYLNRIQQMEHATFKLTILKKDGVWLPGFDDRRSK